MDPQRILSLFGHSECDPEVRKLLKELGLPEKPANNWGSYSSDSISLTLNFSTRNIYLSSYGEPVKRYTDTHTESFLSEVTFNGWKNKPEYPYPLPFYLKTGDSPAEVAEKIKLKPSEKRKTHDGARASFFLENVHVMVAYDESEKLAWVRVWQIEKAEIRKRELKNSLRSQKKNISADNISQLKQLAKPITDWQERMQEGDSMFTQENIAATDALLDNYLADLSQAAEKKKPEAIFAAVKKLVKALNKLNDKYDSYIETLEREELAEYIHKAVAITGFAVEKGTDLTEEWREW